MFTTADIYVRFVILSEPSEYLRNKDRSAHRTNWYPQDPQIHF